MLGHNVIQFCFLQIVLLHFVPFYVILRYFWVTLCNFVSIARHNSPPHFPLMIRSTRTLHLSQISPLFFRASVYIMHYG